MVEQMSLQKSERFASSVFFNVISLVTSILTDAILEYGPHTFSPCQHALAASMKTINALDGQIYA